jgi:hypothetical protein
MVEDEDGEVLVFTPWGEVYGGPAQDAQDIAACLHAAREQGPCVVCGHYACPDCLDWCDVINDGGMCCEGQCSYVAGNAAPE